MFIKKQLFFFFLIDPLKKYNDTKLSLRLCVHNHMQVFFTLINHKPLSEKPLSEKPDTAKSVHERFFKFQSMPSILMLSNLHEHHGDALS